jgi:hypothetical protein
VLKVLNALHPQNNPFQRFRSFAHKQEQLVADLFDSFSRLIIALLLQTISVKDTATGMNTAAYKALSETEQQVLSAFQQWEELFVKTDEGVKQPRKDKRRTEDTTIDLDEIAIHLIDQMITILAKLRNELQHSLT